MTHPDFEYKFMLERRRNDLAAAEYSRQVKIALDAQKENRSLRNSFRLTIFFQSILHLAGQGLTLVGMRIQGWGCQLQVRYAIRGSSSAPCE